VDVFKPLALSAREETTPGEYDYAVLARLRPGVSVAAARATGARLATRHLDWRALPADLPRFDVVLASDVLYERRQVGVLLGLLPRLVGGRGQVWIADPGRRPAERFLAQAAADWRIRSLRSPERPSVTVHRLRRRR
jgi:predicted nicotinamide N-methyase